MEPTPSSGPGSGICVPDMAESLHFEEEIQSLIHPSFDAPTVTGKNSFTALLGLPANQAVELLHDQVSTGDLPGAAAAFGGEVLRLSLGDHTAIRLPFCFSPTFPSNAALVERATRFSVFATEESPASSSGGVQSPKPKAEPADSDGLPIWPVPAERLQRPAKRKDSERSSKVKAPAKKNKVAEGTGGEKLPYVHVRARRGQATDSHSLAERARREKINARMKLLQELVPGCSKISGTALVLDEIINHVQFLQRQVEFLSMRLAAVNPRIDFSGLDSFLSAKCGFPTAGSGRSGFLALEPPNPWSSDAATRQSQQQIWNLDLGHHPQQEASTTAAAAATTVWERDDAPAPPHSNNSSMSMSMAPSSLFGGYRTANTEEVSLHSNQLKTEL